MSRARPSGRLPSNQRKLTETLPVFCSMKMTKTMNRSTETQMPTHVAPVRVRVTRTSDDDGEESAGNGDFVSAGLAGLPRLRCNTDTTVSIL